MSVREIVVLVCFITVPVALLLLHIFLSFRKKGIYGFVAPIIWILLSIWIINNVKGDGTFEMIILCIIIEIILLVMQVLCRFIKKYKKTNKL